MLRLLRLLRLAFWRAFVHDAFAIAKASAYSSILTFFPVLLIVGSGLANWRKGGPYLREISYALGSIMPAGSNTALNYLKGAAQHPISLLATTSLITLWTASGVMISWMEGFRKAYQMPKIWLIATLTSISVIALIYHNAVPRTQPWHSVIPGASLATVLWFSVTIGFRSYLEHFGNFATIYGSLGVAMALLVWMYLISLVVLVGAEFNALLFPRAMLGKELTAINSTRAVQ